MTAYGFNSRPSGRWPGIISPFSLSVQGFNSRPSGRWPAICLISFDMRRLFQFTAIWEMAAMVNVFSCRTSWVSIHGHLGDGRCGVGKIFPLLCVSIHGHLGDGRFLCCFLNGIFSVSIHGHLGDGRRSPLSLVSSVSCFNSRPSGRWPQSQQIIALARQVSIHGHLGDGRVLRGPTQAHHLKFQFTAIWEMAESEKRNA
ncbi:Uncharacterised protein [Avibacterium avium]|uniref:Uncharacterized protein n=1 Tax=Avibacterium avium TaxID=751 RepID=A0A379AST9_AVIAV|nr:Uncharacterised protein [Avibacterium avium]